MTDLETESPHPDHPKLDEYETRQLVAALIDDQGRAADAVRRAAASITAAVNAAVPRLEAGGRLIYFGAGTSGRLGLLDSVELYPTFSWPPERALALLAGGSDAIMRAVEGAEDNRERGAEDFPRGLAHAERRRDPARRLGDHAVHDGGAGDRAGGGRAHHRHRQQRGRAGRARSRDRHRARDRLRAHLRQHAPEGRHRAEDRAQHLLVRGDGAHEQGVRQPDGGPEAHQREAEGARHPPHGARHRRRRRTRRAPSSRRAAST
jgi:hypothetical protein